MKKRILVLASVLALVLVAVLAVPMAAAASSAVTEAAPPLILQPASADLTSIDLSGSPTGYTFAGSTYDYIGVGVANGVASITVTPTSPTSGAVITVDGATVASGATSDPINLTAGTAVTITVVTTDPGSAAKTYTIVVTEAAPLPASNGLSGWLIAVIVVVVLVIIAAIIWVILRRRS